MPQREASRPASENHKIRMGENRSMVTVPTYLTCNILENPKAILEVPPDKIIAYKQAKP